MLATVRPRDVADRFDDSWQPISWTTSSRWTGSSLEDSSCSHLAVRSLARPGRLAPSTSEGKERACHIGDAHRSSDTASFYTSQAVSCRHERTLGSPTGQHLSTRDRLDWNRSTCAHHPRVAGSNPAPATVKVQVRHGLPEVGGRLLIICLQCPHTLRPPLQVPAVPTGPGCGGRSPRVWRSPT